MAMGILDYRSKIHYVAALTGRQDLNDTGNDEFIDDGEVPFWFTRTGQIIRWSIFFGILLLFIAFMTIGYWHARRRIKKGLPPLRYHAWLLNRQQRAQFDPNYRDPRVYYNSYPQGSYGMHAMPPPMYNPNAARPPTYEVPEGGTKVDPSQWRSQPTRRPNDDGAPSYDAPAGPPPAAVQANHTGASTTSNNPFRL